MARDLESWKRDIERRLVALRGLPAVAQQTALDAINKEKAEVLANQPTAPIEITFQTAFYIDRQGRRRSRLMVDFPDVTKSVKAEDITIERYELWGRDETASILDATTDAQPGEALPGLTLPGLTTTEQTQLVAAEVKP